MSLVEQIEALVDEYIAQVPDDDGDEWYGDYRDFARSVLKGDESGYEEFEPFLKWLKRRETREPYASIDDPSGKLHVDFYEKEVG